MRSAENPSNWLSLDYIHDRVLAQLDPQNERWESADARLRLILGLIGVVFAVASGFVSRGIASVPGTEGSVSGLVYLSFWVGGPLGLGLGLYLLAGLIVVVAYWPLMFWRPPEPARLRNDYLTSDVRITKLETLDTVILFLAKNESALNWKLRAFKVALILATVATGLLASAVIIQLLGITRPLT